MISTRVRRRSGFLPVSDRREIGYMRKRLVCENLCLKILFGSYTTEEIRIIFLLVY